MIARWQRAFILSTLLAMAAWLAWQWPRSPLCAVLGALLPLGIYLLVMAVQFLLMHRANRADPARLPEINAAVHAVVELAAKDLNAQGGVFCPSPKADMKLWNSHPKVYLDVARTGDAKCPYCGTVYRLKAGETVRAGH